MKPTVATTFSLLISSCAICTPRSFFASSSRSISSILRPMTPPLALISSTASLTPSRIETPIGLDPPVNGPETPILIVSAAIAANDIVAALTIRSDLTANFMNSSKMVFSVFAATAAKHSSSCILQSARTGTGRGREAPGHPLVSGAKVTPAPAAVTPRLCRRALAEKPRSGQPCGAGLIRLGGYPNRPQRLTQQAPANPSCYPVWTGAGDGTSRGRKKRDADGKSGNQDKPCGRARRVAASSPKQAIETGSRARRGLRPGPIANDACPVRAFRA